MSIKNLGVVFEWSAPDNGKVRNHAKFTALDAQWPSDYRFMAEKGFKSFRGLPPWTFVQTGPNQFEWDVITRQLDLMDELGVTVTPVISHFSWVGVTNWLRGKNAEHAVLNPDLQNIFGDYVNEFLNRFASRISRITPIMEIGSERDHRALAGDWGPNQKDNKGTGEAIVDNLVECSNVAARLAYEYGILVVSCEEAKDLAVSRRLISDFVGINYYMHLEKKTLADYLMEWNKVYSSIESQPKFVLSEWGSPESYDPFTGKFSDHEPVPAGKSPNRMKQLRILAQWLAEAIRGGVEIDTVNWYALSNKWSQSLTEDMPGFCDRNGLVDLDPQINGGDLRIPCHELIEAFSNFSSLLENYLSGQETEHFIFPVVA